MNFSDAQAFDQAVELAHNGAKDEAHAILNNLIRRNPANVNLLLWWAFTANELTSAQYAIQAAAKIEPNNLAITEAQQWLAQLEQSHANTLPLKDLETFATSSAYATPAYSASFQRSPNNGTTQTDNIQYHSTYQKFSPTPPPIEINYLPQQVYPEPLPSSRSKNTIKRPKPNISKNLYSFVVVLAVGFVTFLVLLALASFVSTSSDYTPKTFISKEGNFNLTMPGKPDQQTDTLRGRSFALNEHRYPVSMDFGNLTYTAIYIDLDLPTMQQMVGNPHATLAMLAKAYLQRLSTDTETELQLGPSFGLDINYTTNQKGVGEARFYLYGSRVLGVVFENNGTQQPPLNEQQFLNSFKFPNGQDVQNNG